MVNAGYDALTVDQQRLSGAIDPVIATVCRLEQRVIVTLDLDFADVRMYPPADFCGGIVLRLPRLNNPNLIQAFNRLIPLLSVEPLAGKPWIVEASSVRIRG